MKILALFNCEQAVEKLGRDFADAGEHNLTVCDTVSSSLEYLKQETPDVVMCQMQLPGEEMEEFLKSLNGHETASHVSIIGCYVCDCGQEQSVEGEPREDAEVEDTMRRFGHSKFIQPQTFYSYFLKHEVIDATRKVSADPALIARTHALTA